MGKIADDTPHRRVITRLGGVRAFARRFGVPESTVKSWRARGRIPEHALLELRDMATDKGIRFTQIEEEEHGRGREAAAARAAAGG